MAGPYELVMITKEGGQVSVYLASSMAVGTLCPVRADGIAASSGDMNKLSVNRAMTIVDYYTGETAGQVEILKNGESTNFNIRTDATIAASVGQLNRPIKKFVLQPGQDYQFRVLVAGAA